MKIKITEPYLWLPVDAKEEKVLLHLYSEGEKIDEIAIRLGVTDCDYYAYKDVSAYKNKELEIIRYDEGNLDRIFQYPEKPQTVYPFRPKLHYHMAAGWCNDPCGLVYADGIYHLYHQCNPYGPEWENMRRSAGEMDPAEHTVRERRESLSIQRAFPHGSQGTLYRNDRG